MASAPTSNKPIQAPQPQKAGRKKSGGIMGVIVAVMLAIGAVMLLPTTLIVVTGVIPMAVAFFVDSSKERMLGPTVTFLNFAGLLPLLVKLWQQGHTVDNALSILAAPHMMLLILIPSSVGWLLYNYVPVMVSGIVRRKAEARIRALERDQEKLVEEWGASVIGNTHSAASSAGAEN
jgi:hypothetical protein